MVPRKQAGHMTCTRPQAERQILLATRASSTHDPKRPLLCIALQNETTRARAYVARVRSVANGRLGLQFGSFERSTAAPRRITCEILRVLAMSSMGFASSTIK